MKLERLHESVLPTIVLTGGLLLAILCGSLAGTGNSPKLAMIFGAMVAIALLVALRERVWMLIPATGMLMGKISVLPLPFTVAHLGILFAFGTFLTLKALKIVRLKPKIGIVEIWMFASLAYLATVFLRNPVGMAALGSDRVGGRPYFDVIVSFLAFWVLARSVATPTMAFLLPLFVVAGNGLVTLVNAIAFRFPSTVVPLANLYSGIAAAEDPDLLSNPLDDDSSRKTYTEGFGSSLFAAACSYWQPLTVVNPVYFGRFLVFLYAAYLILQSGFRNALLSMILVFMFATYFRHGMVRVVKGIGLLVVVLSLLLVSQGTVFNLPHSAQRALSFLPGKWDYSAKQAAEGSTDWRIEMWKTMLTGNKYIENKWLGDGFGFTKYQLDIMNANMRSGTNVDQQENLMISGGVHSGPVSAIRYVGYVGLALFMVLLVLMAIRAVRLIRRAEGTPFYPLALFTCIGAVWFPFKFVVVFGAYEGDLPRTIIAVGMQMMLENSLAAYEATQKTPTAPVKPLQRMRRPTRFAPVMQG